MEMSRAILEITTFKYKFMVDFNNFDLFPDYNNIAPIIGVKMQGSYT